MDFLPIQNKIAYFSMEIALDNNIPTYSGGLGVLAGDTLKSAADIGVPVIAVSLIYHKGYFIQKLDKKGTQISEDVNWNPREILEPMPNYTKIVLENKDVYLKCWKYVIYGVDGHEVPVYFLDANLEDNAPDHRVLTDKLYGGDQKYRILQEAILGIGGIRMLQSLGYSIADMYNHSYNRIYKFHMNEGHAAFLTLALLYEKSKRDPNANFSEIKNWVVKNTVFTTHTPVAAGHDIFNKENVLSCLDDRIIRLLNKDNCWSGDSLNMTHLALNFSSYVNGVAKRHGEVSRSMFTDHEIAYITNGVHAYSWTADSIRKLFDRHIPKWKKDNFYFRALIDISREEVKKAHLEAKRDLIQIVKKRSDKSLDEHVFTIGFARRAAEYKRADFMFHDIKRINYIAQSAGPIQIIFAGKAHPNDDGGKALIARIYDKAQYLDKDKITFVYVENYDMEFGRAITSGVDLWINNPVKPLEASGTSGMKAAINGVPSLSTLDGWWVEGWIEGVTGWLIEDNYDMFAGYSEEQRENMRKEAIESMYQKLGEIIIPMYYNDPREYAKIMRSTIAINGPYFNTHRMVGQYLLNAYK